MMLDKSPDLTRLVDRLLVKELVERESCQDNRRKVNIKISDKGLQFLEDLEPMIVNATNQYEGNLTDEEASQLSDLLDKLRG